MPRQVAASVDNNFSRGLVTEATGLNFPENACTETFDCVFDRTGKVTRRLGYDLEANYVKETVSWQNVAVNEFLWRSVAGIGTINFAVVQIGATLYFYTTEASTSLSSGLKSFTINLTTYLATGAPSLATIPCQFASGNGWLFVVHPYLEPFYVEYDPDTDTITETEIDIKIRDFDGLEDGLDPGERPAALTTEHRYNLFNQGWWFNSNAPLTSWDSARTDFPSNSDVWWVYKNSSDNFDTSYISKVDVGNSPAPKGHYILSLVNQDRSTASGISGISVQTTSYFRPSSIAFFAGRVFYAGVNRQSYSNKIYFSQVVLADDQVEKCYQANDPTAEDKFDLLTTDGGVIVIPEIGNVIKLFTLGNKLLVFASNGVWAISGSQGLGFVANDYSVDKISSVPSVNFLSFVDVEGQPMWWNLDGIYTVTSEPPLNELRVVSVSDETIKSFYELIPANSRKYVKGVYNSLDKVVQWVYRSTNETDISDRYIYDRVLNFYTLTNAFYPWRIPTVDARVLGVMAVEGTSTISNTEDVTNGGVPVTNSAVTVTATLTTTSESASVFKYLVVDSGDNGFAFAETSDADYVDWFSIEADNTATYESYFITGYRIRGSALMRSQVHWVVIFSEVESESSCFVQPIWDYANTPDSGRFGQRQQIYTHNADYDIVQRRLKIRGKGRSMQMKFFSNATGPFNVIGWSSMESATQGP